MCIFITTSAYELKKCAMFGFDAIFNRSHFRQTSIGIVGRPGFSRFFDADAGGQNLTKASAWPSNCPRFMSHDDRSTVTRSILDKRLLRIGMPPPVGG